MRTYFYLFFFFTFVVMFGHKLIQKCLALMKGSQENRGWNFYASEFTLCDSNLIGSREEDEYFNFKRYTDKSDVHLCLETTDLHD